VDEAGNLGGEIEQEAFAAHAVFTHEQAVIAAVDDDGVAIEAAVFELGAEFSDGLVESRDDLEVADVVLAQGGSVVVVGVVLLRRPAS